MTLREYFERDGAETQTEFAGRIGVTRAALSHYVTGRRTPPGPTARQIVEESGGLVGYEDLFPVSPATPAATQERVNG